MLCDKIRNYIDDCGIKYGVIAERAEITPQTFSAMLNGKRKITAEEYFAICNALSVSLDKFAV